MILTARRASFVVLVVVLGAAGCGGSASSQLDGLAADLGSTLDTSGSDGDAADVPADDGRPRHDWGVDDTPTAEPSADVAPDPSDVEGGEPDAPAEFAAETEPDLTPPPCECGDGECQPQACGEFPSTCSNDCPLWVCGNGLCELGEAVENCPADCGVDLCGNGECEEGEDALSCAPDCALDCPPCHDDDPCTEDLCDPFTGTCVFPLLAPSGAPDATCDGVDDDCDSSTDEDFVAEGTTCGVGACAAAGVLTCESGQAVDSCAPLPPTVEVCNGVDDDCNGPTDDGLLPLATACGVGACAATGELACVEGQPVDTCAPGAPTAEACNGVDDDCNAQVDEACPCPVRVYGGHAYEFCTQVGKWTVARDACAAHGGYHLVIVTDDAENQWVTATAATFSGDPWWLGASDRDKEGTFVWVDGSPVGFAPWDNGEPNDQWWSEDCVGLLIDQGGDWNDEDCDSFSNFVCEHE